VVDKGGSLSVRRQCALSIEEGYWGNRKRVQRLMRTMELEALCPGRSLSKAKHARKVYPYLLRNLIIDRPN
jgi:putative transposase